MADVVLFHHVLGVTSGCRTLADTLRRAGHTVHLPDLFDGLTFPTIDEGSAHVERVGFDEVLQRGCASIDGLPARLVYVGWSLGAMPAQRLAQTRSGAAGAVLLEGCAPVDAFADAWPARVPVQIHGMSDDEFFSGEGDIDNARDVIAQAEATARAELFTYDGDAHLFIDDSTAGHEPVAAALVIERIIDFLRNVDGTTN